MYRSASCSAPTGHFCVVWSDDAFASATETTARGRQVALFTPLFAFRVKLSAQLPRRRQQITFYHPRPVFARGFFSAVGRAGERAPSYFTRSADGRTKVRRAAPPQYLRYVRTAGSRRTHKYPGGPSNGAAIRTDVNAEISQTRGTLSKPVRGLARLTMATTLWERYFGKRNTLFGRFFKLHSTFIYFYFFYFYFFLF